MMVRSLAAGLAMMTIGCAPVPPESNSDEPAIPVGSDAVCDAVPAQSLIGQTASTALGAEALRLTGARGLRWIQPGQAVTMDYRQDRLNIELDGNNRVVALRCG
jgi:hypothetical protein